MQTVLDLSDVTLARGGRRILDNVSWTTHPGEHWVILGPNGAGKTSLLRVASGRETPNNGTVTACGVEDAHTGGVDLNAAIGFTSQSLAQRIRPSLSVFDVVRTAAWGAHETWQENYDDVDNDRAEALLAAFEITDLRDRPFGSISEGERQRTLLARSLMTDPEVLVLDEPGAGLDLGGREILVSALAEIVAGKNPPQIVLITHQVEEIPPGMTHAVVMTQGRILAAGPIEQVVTGVTLSEAYNLPLVAGCEDGRWWARAVPMVKE